MAKYILLTENTQIVAEVIESEAIETLYTPDFVQSLFTTDQEEVYPGWVYDEDTQTFSEPKPRVQED